MSTSAAILLGALMVAHYLGDFTPLATARMQRAKANGGPVGPIAAHAAVHGLLVGLAVLIVIRPSASVLALAAGLELAVHFALDATRARLGADVPALADPNSNLFWWALGLDQLLHGLVLIGIAVLVLG
ncbi:MAG: DUF3307 domain-containing protein [Gemmatimonadota bacterium]